MGEVSGVMGTLELAAVDVGAFYFSRRQLTY
jgi:hypothetical protein